MSKLNYGGIFCISAKKKDVSKLQKLQNRSLRICCRTNRYTSNIPLHRKSNVLPLYLRRNLDTYKIMFKRMVAEKREVIDNDTSRIVTRYSASKPPIFVSPRSNKFLNSISYQAPLLWAGLPNDIKKISDYDKFSSSVKKIVRAELAQLDRI